MDAGSCAEPTPVGVSALVSSSCDVSHRPRRFRLPLGSALVAVAAIAPAMALYFRLADKYPSSDVSPDVLVLALIVTGLAVGLARNASFLQIVVQIGLASALILAVLELGTTVGLGYVMVFMLAAILVVPLLIKRLLGGSAEGRPGRARLLGICTLSTNSFLNLAALMAFGLAYGLLVEGFGPVFYSSSISVTTAPAQPVVPPPPPKLAPAEQPKAKLVLSWPVVGSPGQNGQPAAIRRVEQTFDLEFPTIESPRLHYTFNSPPTSGTMSLLSPEDDFQLSTQPATIAGNAGSAGPTDNPTTVVQSPSFNREAVPDNMVKRAGAGAMVDENGKRIVSPAAPEVGKANPAVMK